MGAACTTYDESCESSYFSSLRPLPLLSQDDEQSLAFRKNKGDSIAREGLITSNLRLVIKIAKGYVHFEHSLIDLIQEGNMGLIRAAEKFDPDMGCRFSTYASYWIKHYITRFIAKTGRSIRMPIRKTDLFRKLQVEREQFINIHGMEPTAKDLSILLGVSEKEVSDLKEYFQPMMSLETPLNFEECNLHDFLGDDRSQSPDNLYARKEMYFEMHEALNSLVENEREILKMRYGFNDEGAVTLKEAGEYFGISAETVRQIEMRAMDKIRRKYGHLASYVD